MKKLQNCLKFIVYCYKKIYTKKPLKNGENKENIMQHLDTLKRKSCSEVYATRDVLSQQLQSELVQEQELLKGLSVQDKVKLFHKLNSLLLTQFDSLVDRVNKL